MLQLVNAGHKSLADYASLATRGLIEEIHRLAEPMRGKRVVHLSATAFGGGVAEINYALIPLMANAGLDVEWRIIKGADDFFAVTKTIHNALQGDERGLTEAQKQIFRRYNAENAEEFEDDYDFVIVHDLHHEPIRLQLIGDLHGSLLSAAIAVADGVRACLGHRELEVPERLVVERMQMRKTAQGEPHESDVLRLGGNPQLHRPAVPAGTRSLSG